METGEDAENSRNLRVLRVKLSSVHTADGGMRISPRRA